MSRGGVAVIRVALLALVLIGCAMSNDDVIATLEKCAKAGLATHTARTLNGSIASVQCVPKSNLRLDEKICTEYELNWAISGCVHPDNTIKLIDGDKVCTCPHPPKDAP